MKWEQETGNRKPETGKGKSKKSERSEDHALRGKKGFYNLIKRLL